MIDYIDYSFKPRFNGEDYTYLFLRDLDDIQADLEELYPSATIYINPRYDGLEDVLLVDGDDFKEVEKCKQSILALVAEYFDGYIEFSA